MLSRWSNIHRQGLPKQSKATLSAQFQSRGRGQPSPQQERKNEKHERRNQMKRAVFLGAMLVVVVLLPLHLAPPIAASATTYSFNLIGPNTAENIFGRTFRLTGSGTFDTGAKSVVASGSFTVFLANGSRLRSGTWQATAFTSFAPFGGPNPGTQGGVLKITITLFPDGIAPITGLPMIVTCLVNAPTGFTGDEGTTAGDFTKKSGGHSLFHLDN